MGNLEKLMVPTSKKVRQEECKTHGMFESRNIINNLWTPCPKCGEEERQREDAKARQQDAELRARAISSNAGIANIPPRHANASFDNYLVESDGQKKAMAETKAFAEEIVTTPASGRSLIFTGDMGNGKTHLAIAACRHLIERGRTAGFVSMQRLARSVKETFNGEGSEAEVIARYTAPDLLVVDELGVQFRSEFEHNLLFDVLNERYEQKKSCILISNLDLGEICAILGDRVIDRLHEDGVKIIRFNWESYRHKAVNMGIGQ